jgi:hypothetical protein
MNAFLITQHTGSVVIFMKQILRKLCVLLQDFVAQVAQMFPNLNQRRASVIKHNSAVLKVKTSNEQPKEVTCNNNIEKALKTCLGLNSNWPREQ